MRNSGDRNGAGAQQPSQHRWKGARSIGLAQQLNQEFIELCCELSVGPEPEKPFPLVASHRDQWSRLDPKSRKRLALFPFVIVDLRFGDVACWCMAAGNSAHMRGNSDGTAPAARWEWLALETLMFGWQVAREDRGVASMLLGMPPPVADCIAALTMQQVRTLALKNTACLRLRWDDDPRLWRELLIAAREVDEPALEALRREAKLHFCGELIHAQASGDAHTPLTGETSMDMAHGHQQ